MTRRKVTGERKPGGRLKAAGPPDPRFPTLWRRIKDHGTRVGIHPDVGTVLGRLSLSGVLRDHQVEAGFRFAELIGAYHRLCSGARPYAAASPAYERGFGAASWSGGGAVATRLERAARRARRRYDDIAACIPGAAAHALLVEVCVLDQEPGWGRLADLSALLGVLALRLQIRDRGGQG